MSAISSELIRVYKAARRSDIEVSEASKLANILGIARLALEGSELERRLQELEVLVAAPAPTSHLKLIR